MDWFVKFVLDNCAKLKRDAFIPGISNGWAYYFIGKLFTKLLGDFALILALKDL